MESDFVYQGHNLTHSDITSVKTLITKNNIKTDILSQENYAGSGIGDSKMVPLKICSAGASS